jgi:uncharacterized protein YjbI with pentapeptide repeats
MGHERTAETDEAHFVAELATGRKKWDQLVLPGANLAGAVLSDCDLRGSVLRRVNLAGAQLQGALLVEADLRGADLRGAKLVGADLRGADLRLADLTGADLTGADLHRADLRRCIVRQAQLDRASVTLACETFDGVAIDGGSLRQLLSLLRLCSVEGSAEDMALAAALGELCQRHGIEPPDFAGAP